MDTRLSLLLWLYKSKANAAGKAPIYLRITIGGSKTEISTGQYIDVDWQAIFDKHPHKLNKKKCVDALNYIIGQLTYLSAIHREDLYKYDTDLIPLCTRYLKPIIRYINRFGKQA